MKPIQLALTVLAGLNFCVPARAATHVVEMSNFRFQPASITINVGDTVTWVNRQGSHDVQSSNSSLFKSPLPIQSYSVTFTEPGTVPYHCNPHRSFGMVGQIVVEGAANEAPSVSIVSPESGASFVAPASIVIEADASDSDGSIAQVEFLRARSVLGADSSEPFQFTVEGLEPGEYSFSSRATDDQGLVATSDSITVTVLAPSTPPALASPELLPDGSFRFAVSGTAGRLHEVQASFDGEEWTTVSEFVMPSEGSFIFTDDPPVDGESSHSFYRVNVP